jgi:hypothetical protein
MSAAVFGVLSRSGFTPLRPHDYQMMLPVMDIKTWLVEMEVAACLLVGAITALILMVGHTLWLCVARK